MAGRNRDHARFGKTGERFGESPYFDGRFHAALIAELANFAIALAGCQQIDRRVFGFGSADGGGGDVRAANLCDLVHVALHLLQPFGALGIVIDDPLRKADRTWHSQAVVGQLLAQVFERAAFFLERFELAHPRFDRVEAGAGCDFDSRINTEVRRESCWCSGNSRRGRWQGGWSQRHRFA